MNLGINNQRGYTLVELILVMTLLGILGYAAIPNDPGLAPISLDAAARKVKADIRYAQNLATTTNQPHGFRVLGATTYEIYNATTGVVATSPLTNTSMQSDLSDDFQGAEFQAQNYQVVFDSLGRPTTGGGQTFTLVDDQSPISKQIQISTTTGYVRLL